MTTPASPSTDHDLSGYVQAFDTRFLVAIHRGEVDVVRLARQELMNRGLDGEGRWIGFATVDEALRI
jgi:hypothetical protein